MHLFSRPRWYRQIASRAVYLWPLKAVGTMSFMALFFWGYFGVLRNPLAPIRNANGAVTHYVGVKEDITLRRRSEELVHRLAYYDPLTGLPNRVVLEDHLTRALVASRGPGAGVGVLFIDLDRFKEINDTLGHDAGDVLLRDLGIRLAGAVRHTDTVFRLGGDEFVVVCENLVDVLELDAVADRIHKALAEPVFVNGRSVVIAASIGTATGENVTASELLRRADNAMYHAKKRINQL